MNGNNQHHIHLPPKSREFGVALEPEVLVTCCYAFLVGIVAGLVAQGLLQLINLLTNLAFHGQWTFRAATPLNHHLGLWVVLIPPIGAFIVGLMIHLWEPTLKGHGIPEAMEAILMFKSRVRTRVGFLKPIATAIAIGTGGPFGAEGPIIQTGAAFGSVFARYLKLTPYQSRVLLGAGAAAGMAATFLSPFAGILVAVELLLFEFRARSFIPVAIASVVATSVAVFFRGWTPLFPMPAFELRSLTELWIFALMGVLMGGVGILMIRVLFWLEDAFDRLPLKPVAIWAPVVGALMLGGIGYFFPQVFGTGYSTIRDMLNDRLSISQMLGVSIAKFWALVLSLGSGTTGGVFAPSLIVGGGIGAAYASLWHHWFPTLISDPALYALVAMAAVFGGIARAPFTSIVFLFELSRNPNAILPLVVCVMVADGFVRLFSAESIMTGKLVKRGVVVCQDYTAPLLRRARIAQVMRTEFVSVSADDEAALVLRQHSPKAAALDILAVVDAAGQVTGVVGLEDLLRGAEKQMKVRELARRDYVLAHPRDTVDRVTHSMLSANAQNAIVLDGGAQARPIGIVGPVELLQLRRWVVEEESRGYPDSVPQTAAPVGVAVGDSPATAETRRE